MTASLDVHARATRLSTILAPSGRTQVLAVFTIAMLTRIGPLLGAKSLTAFLEYDDGVYYSGAAHLIRGAAPYRDFIFVHPPGILIVLLPLVEMARFTGDNFAMALARVLFTGIGALNATLVYILVRRHSRLGAFVAGILYAVWRLPASTEHTIMLEPLISLLLLLGLTTLVKWGDARSNKWLLISGVLTGLAVGTKLWAAPEALVLFIYLLLKVRSLRSAIAWGGSALASFIALCFPFAISDLGGFARQVLIIQLGRNAPDTTRQHLERWADIAGIGGLGHLSVAIPRLALALTVIVILISCAMYSWRMSWSRLYICLATIACFEIAVAPVYWYHYFAFAAAPVAIVVGAVAHRIQLNIHVRQWPLIAFPVVFVVLGVSSWNHGAPDYGDRAQLRSFVAARHCVWFESASVAIMFNSLTRQLGRGCNSVVDYYAVLMNAGFPVAYDSAPYARSFGSLQYEFSRELESSDALLLGGDLQESFLSDQLRAFVRGRFVVFKRLNGMTLWVRNGALAGSGDCITLPQCKLRS